MARLQWGRTGERFYETGTDRGVLFKQDDNGESLAGVAWTGLASVNQSPEGAEPTNLYADNGKYITLRSAEDFNFTIEAYQYPKEFAECDGSAEVIPGVFLGQQARVPFNFAYRTVKGNDTQKNNLGHKLHLIWNATAAPSERAYETINDDPDAILFSWECETVPQDVTVEDLETSAAYLSIDSTIVTEAQWKTITDTIYGTVEEEPRMPSIYEVITLLNTP